jgi:hypothetical protein
VKQTQTPTAAAATITWLRNALAAATARAIRAEERAAAAEARLAELEAAAAAAPPRTRKRKREESENESEGEGDAEGIVAGAKLAKLWIAPAPPRAASVPGRRGGGAPPKSGRQVIAAAAITILAAAKPQRNAAAEALGLGPCLRGRGLGAKDADGRPRKQLTGGVGPGGARQMFSAAEYHITATDHAQQPPPGAPGFSWSHRCHNPRCVEPRHGLWETVAANRARNICAEPGAGCCPHSPVCIPWLG